MGKMKKYREGNDQKIAATPKIFAYGAENGIYSSLVYFFAWKF